MACTDPRIFQFDDAPGDGVYKVRVSGPKGAFTASGDFLDVDLPPKEHWPPEVIVNPARKEHSLKDDHAYVVTIVVQCVATKDDPVVVEASVDGQQFCHEVPCAQGRFERVIHFIKRT